MNFAGRADQTIKLPLDEAHIRLKCAFVSSPHPYTVICVHPSY